MSYLLHIANLFFLASYTVKDILVLRTLTILGMSLVITFFLLQPEPLLIPVFWNIVFCLINSYRIGVIYKERRPVSFSPRDFKLYRLVFGAMADRQFAKLMALGTWQKANAQEVLFPSNKVMDELIVVVEGKIAIKRNKESLASVQSGDFLGEVSLVADLPTTADVVVETPTEYVSFPKKKLVTLFKENPALHASLQQVISRFLIRRLHFSPLSSAA